MSLEKPRVLFVLHLPPPMHGAAAVGAIIRESDVISSAFETRYINLSASNQLGEIGSLSLKKLLRIRQIRRTVARELRSFRPDLVYLTPTSGMPAFLKDLWVVRPALRRRVPMVAHFHNKGFGNFAGKALWRHFYRCMFDHSDAILLSERLYPDVSALIPRERVHICPNGTDLQSFPPRLPGNRDVPRILFLGNMIPSKGVERLLDACRILHKKGIPFRCDFVGKETQEIDGTKFVTWVKARHLEDCVNYLGPLYGSAKMAVYSESDLFAFPTAYPAEAFPMVLLEAMAAGLPCVATPEGGIPDIIEDGVTGRVCEDYRSETLAEALRPLLLDALLRQKMGDAGRARYERLFTKVAFENRLLSILQNCIKPS